MQQPRFGLAAGTHKKYDRLITLTREIPALPAAVAHPCDANSLGAAVEAAEAGIILPILTGPAERIRAVADQAGLNIAPYEIVEARHHVLVRRARREGRDGDWPVHAASSGSGVPQVPGRDRA